MPAKGDNRAGRRSCRRHAGSLGAVGRDRAAGHCCISSGLVGPIWMGEPPRLVSTSQPRTIYPLIDIRRRLGDDAQTERRTSNYGRVG